MPGGKKTSPSPERALSVFRKYFILKQIELRFGRWESPMKGNRLASDALPDKRAVSSIYSSSLTHLTRNRIEWIVLKGMSRFGVAHSFRHLWKRTAINRVAIESYVHDFGEIVRIYNF